jgi:hypothetical protein
MVAVPKKKSKDEKAELRKFSLTLGIVFGLLGGLFLWRERSIYPYFFAAAAVLILLGQVRPTSLRLVHKAWMGLAACLGWVVTRIILFVLFYFIVTPIGLISRLFGRDSLNLRFGRKKEQYWQRKEKPRPEREAYERQY